MLVYLLKIMGLFIHGLTLESVICALCLGSESSICAFCLGPECSVCALCLGCEFCICSLYLESECCIHALGLDQRVVSVHSAFMARISVIPGTFT